MWFCNVLYQNRSTHQTHNNRSVASLFLRTSKLTFALETNHRVSPKGSHAHGRTRGPGYHGGRQQLALRPQEASGYSTKNEGQLLFGGRVRYTVVKKARGRTRCAQ